MNHFIVNQIGVVKASNKGMFIQLEKQYIPALKGLEGFSHINVLWWFDGFDTNEARSIVEVDAPYKNAPDRMGIFATRSPMRPNPIALTPSQILSINFEEGSIAIAYIDANDGSPVIDLKPYTPSLDRVENPKVPVWCRHWPNNMEASASFDWEKVFNF